MDRACTDVHDLCNPVRASRPHRRTTGRRFDNRSARPCTQVAHAFRRAHDRWSTNEPTPESDANDHVEEDAAQEHGHRPHRTPERTGPHRRWWHQRHRHLPRPRPAGRRRRPRRAWRLRLRRLGRVEPHDPRRHPLPRERRVPPGARERAGAQRPDPHRPALRQAAADDDADLLDLLRHHERAAAHADAQAALHEGARRDAHQDRHDDLRLVLPRRWLGPEARLPHQEGRAAGHAGPEPRPQVHRHLLRRLGPRAGAPGTRRTQGRSGRQHRHRVRRDRPCDQLRRGRGQPRRRRPAP